MKKSQMDNQKLFALFLSGIVEDGGWWFRIPKTYPAPLKKVVLPQDSLGELVQVLRDPDSV